MRLSNVFGYLFEQEDKNEKNADEAGEDLFGDEEEQNADEPTDDETKEKENETEPSEDNEDQDESDEDKKDDEKDDENIKISAEDQARLKDSIDDELEGVMTDYETDARKSAQLQSEKMKSESLRRVYKGVLFEVAADDIDLKHFAGNIARLVKNYDTLMDMESIILNKAYAYIQNNYGEDTVKALKDTLEQDFDIEVERPDIEKDEPEIPIAVGAGGASEGGGV